MGYCPRFVGMPEPFNENKCFQSDECEWWDNRQQCCAVLGISFGLDDLRKMMMERN
jgi:hypothetical protein